MIGFHAGLDSTDPIIDEIVEQFLEAEDCLKHVWPAEFQILQRHAAERLAPCLERRRLRDGLVGLTIPLADLQWMIMQTAWLSVYLDTPHQEVLDQLT